MTPDWLNRLKRAVESKGPDINKPVSVGDPMKDLRKPLPDPTTRSRQNRNWNWYQQSERARRYITKTRYT